MDVCPEQILCVFLRQTGLLLIIVHQIFLLPLDWRSHDGKSSAKSEVYKSDIPNFQTFECFEKFLKNNKHNSLHLARKYARIFVPRSPQFSSTSHKTVHFHSRQNTARLYMHHLSIELWTNVDKSGSLEEREMLQEHAPIETSSKASKIPLISRSVSITR